jgi:hypothetical protein
MCVMTTHLDGELHTLSGHFLSVWFLLTIIRQRLDVYVAVAINICLILVWRRIRIPPL